MGGSGGAGPKEGKREECCNCYGARPWPDQFTVPGSAIQRIQPRTRRRHALAQSLRIKRAGAGDVAFHAFDIHAGEGFGIVGFGEREQGVRVAAFDGPLQNEPRAINIAIADGLGRLVAQAAQIGVAERGKA